MRLMFVGDISMGEHFFSFGHGPKSSIEKGQYAFSGVHHLLSEADFLLGNLEGPISNVGHKPESAFSSVFRGGNSAFQQLKKAGFSALGLANNHSVEHGAECFFDTAKSLENNSILVTGVSSEPVIYHECCGMRLAIISASDIYEKHCSGEYLAYNLEELLELVRITSEKSDCLIVNLHWGVEMDISASNQQKLDADALVDAGADVIVGHHPHVVFEFERTKNKAIAYSLGNFVFDLPWDVRMTKSAILDLNYSGSKLVEMKVWPVNIDANGFPFVAGDARAVSNNSSCTIYEHKCGDKYGGIKKVSYFLKNFFKGNKRLKYDFIKVKIKDMLH